MNCFTMNHPVEVEDVDIDVAFFNKTLKKAKLFRQPVYFS